MTGEQAIKTLKKQYQRQNEYIKNNYDRFTVTLPKGTKDRIQAAGETANGLIKRLVLNWLDARQNAPGTQETPRTIENPQTAGNAHTQPETIKDSLRQPETAGEDPTEIDFLPFE